MTEALKPATILKSSVPPMWRRWNLPVAFALLSIVLLAVQAVPQTYSVMDYPSYIISAQRTAAGERPFADFNVAYGPLGHYVAAVWLTIFHTMSAAYALSIQNGLFLLVLVWAIYVATRTMQTSQPALKWPLFAYSTITLLLLAQASYYSTLSILLLIFCGWALERTYRHGELNRIGWLWEILFAFAAAAVAFIRFNFGLYVFFAMGLTALAAVAFRLPHAWTRLARLILFSLAALALFAAIFNAFGILKPFVQQSLLFAVQFQTRHIPLAYTSTRKMTMALLAAAVLLLWLLRLLLLRRVGGALFLGFLYLPLIHYQFMRLDPQHLLPTAAILPFLLAWSRPPDGSPSDPIPGYFAGFVASKRGTLVLMSALLFLTGAAFIIEAARDVLIAGQFWTGSLPYVYVQRNGVFIHSIEAGMLDDMAAQMKPDDRVFWGNVPGSCESPIQWGVNLNFYLAAHQLPTTRYWVWDPPYTLFPDVQNSIVHDLEQQKVAWIGVQGLIDPTVNYLPGNPKEPTIFYDYVRMHYDEVTYVRFPTANIYYEIYHRRPPN